MKTKILKSVLAIFMLSISLISCDRDESSDTPLVEAASLRYVEGGGVLTSVTNPFANATSKTIFGNNGSSNVVEINLTSLGVGTYTIGSGNAFRYTRPSTSSVWTAVSGRITISSVAGNKLTGDFDLNAGDSDLGINSVTGKFINLVINP
jgi:Family of unknown function (DUF6252)